MAKETGIQKLKRYGKNTAYGLGGSYGLTMLDNVLRGLNLYKDGGRVKGVGKAKRGFGRAMRKK